jgi:hypothetical protein
VTPAIAYLTDVEGRWEKLEEFARDNPLVALDGDALRVSDGAILVFGGDAIDRGPSGRRVVATLLDAKERQPGRVVLLAGNRDINKLRLQRELDGHPPRRAPPEIARAPRGELLRWIFPSTMGARDAFAMRASELGVADDESVAESFLADLAPDGALARYLARCELAFRAGETIFVHGAITSESLGVVPGRSARIESVDAWIAALNDWYAESLDAYRSSPRDPSGYAALVAYQAPVPGTRGNQASVVYGRLSDGDNNPHLPAPDVIERLRARGIERLVIGHTPCGDAPLVLRARGFELVCADNSYARVEAGSRVTVRGRALAIDARAKLDDGTTEALSAETSLDDETLIGRRDAATGHLVGSRLARGAYYLYRGREEFVVEQRAEAREEIARRDLVVPSDVLA